MILDIRKKFSLQEAAGETKPEKKESVNKTKNPWWLEKVENGLKATNIRESSGIPDRKIPIQYFEYSRIFGKGAFTAPLKVLEMFDELKKITPQTKGFIFSDHKYLYHNSGILKVNRKNGKEAFFSQDTLRNESVSCYLELIESTEESKIKEIIKELDAATSGYTSENQSQRRISYKDSELKESQVKV